MSIEHVNSFITAFIVIQGFFVSRIFIYCGIIENIALYLLKKSRGNIKHVFIFILAVAIISSCFIANIIAILTLLPLVRNLKQDFDLLDFEPSVNQQLTTLLTFSAMFGANLGGIGTLTASPSHLILFWFMSFHHIPHLDMINFFTWLLWGIPSIFFISITVYFIITFFLPKEVKNNRYHFSSLEITKKNFAHYSLGIKLSFTSISLWIGISFILQFFKSLFIIKLMFFIIASYTAFLFIFLFFIPLYNPELNKKLPLVPFKGVLSDIPLKGVLILMVSLFISYLITHFHLDQRLIEYFKNFDSIIENYSFLLILSFCSLTLFFSEIISNTACTFIFFTVALPFSQTSLGLPLLLAISLVACIPSMSPIATPVNAFAFGSVKGSSIKTLFKLGFLTNITSVLVISLCCAYLVPFIIKELS